MQPLNFLVLIIFSLLVFFSGAARAGGYNNTCATISIDDNHFIHGACANIYGKFEAFAALNLSECLLNNHGYLGWLPHGGMGKSCRNCRFNPAPIFECSCRIEGNNWRTTSINLNDGVKNDNAKLKCDWQ